MDLIRNDLLKFRRLHIWAVILLVPLLAVAIGAGNYAANAEMLSAGWGSYLSQIMLFYGLTFMTAGVAILAAATWRVEHRGHNWLTMLTSTRSEGSLVASKIVATTSATSAMHGVLLLLAIAGGHLLGIPGKIPPEFLASALLALAPAAAVASWQSLLSMVIRNFAAPIAIGLVAAIVSFGALASGAAGAKYILPPALLSDTLWLGSSAVADAGVLTAGTVITVINTSALMTIAGWFVSMLYLRRTEARI